MTSRAPGSAPAEFVTCETVAAIVLHVRRVTAAAPIPLGGHTAPRPRALCGAPVDWDTQIPVASIAAEPDDNRAVRPCRTCRAQLAREDRL
jgi:hypothetical protein